MKNLVGILLISLAQSAFCKPQTIVDRPDRTSKGLVIIAPAKKYLMQERLFEQLAQSLVKEGFIVVRFNWDAQTLGDPSLELQRAAHDLQTVVQESQKDFNFGRQNTIIISKSFSTKVLGNALDLAKTQLLLTPNCSSEAPFSVVYGKIIEDKKITSSIFISSEDPYCDVRQIHQALALTKNPPSAHFTHGDHNFVTPVSINSSPSFIYQDSIIDMVTNQVLIDSQLP